MGLTNCYHPPAGATALLGGYFSADIERVGWWFPLYPVLPVSLILVAVGVILNNICRVYPIYWFTAADAPKVSVELPVHKSQQATHDSDPVPQEPASTTSSNTRDDSAIPSPEIHADREAGDGTEIAWLRTRVQGLEQEVAELRGATARAD
ncbi:hypothetical protein LPJ61_003532 [Coemansia biformis]|uniref:HPP transmembrane region domain-containing protein n=1 Tax=Coemansia biformis TaxID=1286918 RepID=A0A9W7YDP4_9FUNG|nr:hypothetical protein LPJ61_003532 [Coemansia biformis]